MLNLGKTTFTLELGRISCTNLTGEGQGSVARQKKGSTEKMMNGCGFFI